MLLKLTALIALLFIALAIQTFKARRRRKNKEILKDQFLFRVNKENNQLNNVK